MTKIAAKEEGLELQYSSFKHVIHYHEENSVTYFPGLWYGNPPMAPVNPKYSMRARELKNILIDSIGHHHTIRFSRFISYLETFWNAILRKNFIFSFKNTLELSVFSILDNQRCKWFWMFRKEVITLEEIFETQMHNFVCGNPLNEEAYEIKKIEVVKSVDRIFVKIMAEVKRFFEEHTHKEILINWKAETEKLMASLNDELSKHAEEHCTELWYGIKAKKEVDKIKKEHDQIISEKVKQD